ncbi:hypothetical protein BLNAU_15094 [Blattamonas nauphoetae]|uniref:SH3 domain-containing protein n=1 Tax=Blattamonas nauphoetae TaxID=2049346 RepID=A0ABQ9XF34_9EUKA|nr:hypothetical protein BLNAU_15094 [Blattamonas nauphoetae]
MIKPATPSSISDANSELSNEQKKVCFVSFQTKEEAFAAFQKRGSWRYNGLVPDVWFAPERRPQHNQSETPSAVSQPPTNREARAFPKMGNPTSDSFEVKIVGLPSSTTEAILASALKDVSIVSLRVLYQLKASGKYAFVAVKTKHDQEALIAMQDTLTIDGHKLTIFQPSDTDLRLEQLPQGTTKEELVSLFPNSKVVRVNLFGQKGKIKADVIFANSASLKEALKRTENLELRSHRVQVNRVYHDLVRQEEHRFNFRPANPQEIPKTTSEPAPTPLSDSTVLSPSRYIATANFVEIEGFPGAVEMAHGQIVTIIKQDARGWSYVMIEATGKEGFVPTSYLEQYVPYSPSVFDQLPPPPPPPTQPVQNIAPSPHMPQNWLNPVPSYSQQPYPNMSSQNTIIPSNMIPAAHSYQNYLPAPVPPNAHSCAVQPALNSFAAFAEQMDVRCSSSRLECGVLLTSPAILADDPVPDQPAVSQHNSVDLVAF